jgi:uncharacterized membrane protein YfcA
VTPGLVLALGVFGVLVGTYGTIVGAGGGFLIVPALLLTGLATPEQAAGTALVAVLANAASATVSYARLRRIDTRTAVWLSVVAIPGALYGARFTVSMSGPTFTAVFGGVLAAVALWLIIAPERKPAAQPARPGWGRVHRDLTDTLGTRSVYSLSLPAAVALSAALGVLSSALGIGGGVIMVPFLIQVLGVPTHVATATAQPVLAVAALLGTIVHASMGHVLPVHAAALATGTVIGAQLGSRLSSSLRGPVVVRLLSLALLVTGGRLLWRALG